ncbi:ankyrin repeat domain-containing protein [Gammaproteobacteria bacterium]|nr:ankyrin repeat domain-containing protein [Gammaproteobacteria bacterium]
MKKRNISEAVKSDSEQLSKACKLGHYDEIDRLISILPTTTIETFVNDMLLPAMKHGDLAIVNRLLDAGGGAYLNFSENKALRWAARYGHATIVERLLVSDEVRAQVEVRRNEALRWAENNGHIAVIEKLLPFISNHFYAGSALESLLGLCEQQKPMDTTFASRLLDQSFCRPGLGHNAILRRLKSLLNDNKIDLYRCYTHIEAFKKLDLKQRWHLHLRYIVAIGDVAKCKYFFYEKCKAWAHMDQNILLQHAARNGHIAVVDLLLAIPAVEKLESQSGSALKSALTHNQAAVVK